MSKLLSLFLLAAKVRPSNPCFHTVVCYLLQGGCSRSLPLAPGRGFGKPLPVLGAGTRKMQSTGLPFPRSLPGNFSTRTAGTHTNRHYQAVATVSG